MRHPNAVHQIGTRPVRADGRDYNVGGTSCAAPLWAGFIALVNQQAIAGGKLQVGFLNPAVDDIYIEANYNALFHDITTGNNTSTNSPDEFYAVTGYDLCTGWGTPSGQSLINELVNPESLVVTPATGFAAIGGVGGPFSMVSQTLALTNVGTNMLTWTLANTSLWINVSPAGGTLMPGALPTIVTASLNNTANNLLVGNYTATLWFTNLNDRVGQGRQFSLNIISPPAITVQPADQLVLDGAAATYSVSTTGGLPLSYQWQHNNTNLINGENISGANTTNLLIADVSTNDVGTISVIVTNYAGKTVSSNALLSIMPSVPVIVSQPAGQTDVVGTTANFTVSAIGSQPFYYQWYFDQTNMLMGATNATLVLTGVQSNNAGAYTVLITNSLGLAISSNAILNVVYIPYISSISPELAIAGTELTIVGGGFSSTSTSNTVHFGAVQADVIAASPTSLVVVVPPGATFGAIIVTVSGLTAYSSQLFTPTFSGTDTPISGSSLGAPVGLATGSGPCQALTADIDGDGRPDLLVPNASSGTISIYRNISTNGSLSSSSFAPRVDISLSVPTGGTTPYMLAAADLDGDGRLDIIALDADDNLISILRNISSPGNITTNSFAAPITLAADGMLRGMAVRDLNGDGLPEIVTASQTTPGNISIYQNTSSIGNIVFAPKVDFATDAGATGVAIDDLDGDGRPDVAVACYFSGTVSLLQNVMNPGDAITTNSFAPEVDFPCLANAGPIAVGDIDGDGKPDLVVGGGNGSQQIAVYLNTSTPGTINSGSFASQVNFAAAGWVNTLALADMSGDGQLDIVLGSQLSGALSIYQNQSSPGNISLAPRVDFSSGSDLNGLSIGDLNGDGTPDVVVASYYDNAISVYKNVLPSMDPPVIIQQPMNQAVLEDGSATFTVTAAGTIPLSYQWFFNKTNLLTGETNSVLTLTNLQLSQAGFYEVIVTNFYGTIASSNGALNVADVLDHFTWNIIASPRYANAPFIVSVKACDLTGKLFTNFTGSVTLGSTNGVPIEPSVSTIFIEGLWTGSVIVIRPVTNLVLSANDGEGHRGLSNPITIAAPPVLDSLPSGNSLLLFWPVAFSNFVLETTISLSSPQWEQVPGLPLQIGNQSFESISISTTNRFYRLLFIGP